MDSNWFLFGSGIALTFLRKLWILIPREVHKYIYIQKLTCSSRNPFTDYQRSMDLRFRTLDQWNGGEKRIDYSTFT